MQTLESNTIVIDGFTCDAETGEILGHADIKEQFIPRTPEEVEWVLSKIGKAESALAAVDGHPDVIWAKAILANAEAQRREQAKKLDWLHKRFEADLHQFAAKVLEGQKSRTYKTPVGSIALRTVKGGLRVADPAKALEVAKYLYPEAVKVTEEFRITLLTEEHRASVEAFVRSPDTDPSDEVNIAFRLDPDVEKATIKTGVDS